jgi:hypothetical protein
MSLEGIKLGIPPEQIASFGNLAWQDPNLKQNRLSLA